MARSTLRDSKAPLEKLHTDTHGLLSFTNVTHHFGVLVA